MLVPGHAGCQIAVRLALDWKTGAGGRTVMSGRWAVPLLALAIATPCAAAPEETSGAPPARRRLDLGRYGRVTPPSSAVQTLPHFESVVEVIGEAPRSPNAAMAVHWKQWNLSTGSIYGKGINFQNQGCPTCVNILPAIGKVIDKIKKR